MSLSITCIQSHLHWENIPANLEMFEHKINRVEDPMEVVVLPEMFSTGFSMNAEDLAEDMDGSAVSWMKRISAEKKIVLTGSLIIKEGENIFNRMIWALPNGSIGYYDKRHLFAFAGEDQYYDKGNKRLIASVKGWKINLQICYDLRFPVWARQQVENGQPEYDVLIYVANWPEKRNHAWKTLLQARAIENQCYVAGVNRVGKDGNEIYHSGDTMVVDPMGTVLNHVAHEEDIFTCILNREELDNTRKKLPFLKDADHFLIHT
jgi:omega-amidase